MKKALLSVSAALILIAVGFVYFKQPILNTCCSTEYKQFKSPGGQYTIVVYSTPQIFALPGSAGDAPGYVQLKDINGHVLQQKDVDMVQNIEDIHWQPGQVDIKLFATWPLPNR